MPPRAIVIIRHSERQDHIDTEWKKTAARPHDSPLSEQGIHWSRLAGSCLATILNSLPQEPQDHEPTASAVTTTTGGLSAKDTVCLASPLIRTVQTAHHLASGFEARLAEMNADNKQAPDAQTEQTAAAAASSASIPIFPSRGMLEPAFWQTYDLQRAGFSYAKPFTAAPLLDLDALAQHSDRLMQTDDYHLRHVELSHDAESGGIKEHEDVRIRWKMAAQNLLTNPALDNKVVILVGHGASTTNMYCAILRENGQQDLLINDPDDFLPYYTSFAALARVVPPGSAAASGNNNNNSGGGQVKYANLIDPPFCTPPHLSHILGQDDDHDDDDAEGELRGGDEKKQEEDQ